MAYDPRIGRAFGFTAADLAANAQGRLSPDQLTAHRNTARVGRRRARRTAVWVPLLLLVVVAFVVAALATTGDGTPVAAIVAGVILVWVGGLLTWAVRRNLRHAAAMDAAVLTTDEGPFAWTTTLGEDWVGTIGAARFGVDRLGTEALEVGAVYRIHYLPTDLGAWVMSIERAGDGPRVPAGPSA